jgi:hypothetical protein
LLLDAFNWEASLMAHASLKTSISLSFASIVKGNRET